MSHLFWTVLLSGSIFFFPLCDLVDSDQATTNHTELRETVSTTEVIAYTWASFWKEAPRTMRDELRTALRDSEGNV